MVVMETAFRLFERYLETSYEQGVWGSLIQWPCLLMEIEKSLKLGRDITVNYTAWV